MEAREVLIKHNLRLVVYIAKKYNNYPDQDELISVGTLGLIKAINTYNDTKSTQLATYASRCIENEILMAMRGYKKIQNTVSIYENIGSDKDGNDMSLIDMLSIDEDTVYMKLESEMLKSGLMKIIKKYLSDRERKIVIMRYALCGGEPLTQQEVAEKLGISRSYVSRLEKGILKKLKSGIKNENLEL